MAHGLNIQDVVNVQVNLTPLAAAFRNFGALLIVGSTPVIDVAERIRVYTTLSGVADDFGTTPPEFGAADLFFSQSPQPSILYMGRFVQTDCAGLLRCGVLSPQQQLMSNFTPLINAGYFCFIDGAPVSVSGMNFSDELNLNGVAAQVQITTSFLKPGVTFTWDSNLERFTLQSGTTGPNSSVGYMSAPRASGSIAFTVIPANGDTIHLNGETIIFVTTPPTGSEVQIGATLAATMENLILFLNESTDATIRAMNYYMVGTTLYCVAANPGAAGDSIMISASAATASGPTLAGGSGADFSVLVNGTSTTASFPVQGQAAETPLACIETLDDFSGQWYGALFATAVPISDADHIAVAGYIEGAARSHIYGVTTAEPTVLDPVNNTDIASSMQALNYFRTFVQYSTSSLWAAASMFGRAFTVNFNANNSTITLKFKVEPGVRAETLTESQSATLRAKNCNVFINYDTNTALQAIIQEGVMSNGYFFDEVHGTDWLQNNIQIRLWNLLRTAATKIPQTDPGVNMLVNECVNAMEDAVFNGLIAPGQWNAAGFGQLHQGDYLNKGYYCFVIPMAQQSQTDREQRKAPPIQIAGKFAGAIHFAYVIVTVER
jgi:Protein of unknown function (DUF3383)